MTQFCSKSDNIWYESCTFGKIVSLTLQSIYLIIWLISPQLAESDPAQEGDENNSATEPGTSNPTDKEMPGKLSFQQLLRDLPEKVSGQTAKNLSVPIAFVCLLHLANEKVSI